MDKLRNASDNIVFLKCELGKLMNYKSPFRKATVMYFIEK